MLDGIYVRAFDLFLEILDEQWPRSVTDPLVALFLLVCDISINPTDGFPFTITHAMNCFSPFESSVMICDWIQSRTEIKALLEEEAAYNFLPINQPIRLFFSKFLRFQEDKFLYPQAFCWPGMSFVNLPGNTVGLSEMSILFEKHKALFIDDIRGDIYHTSHEKHTSERLDQTLNDFFTWNSVYDLTREWISEEGPFNLNFGWLSSKHSKSELAYWVSNNFESVFGVRPQVFRILQ